MVLLGIHTLITLQNDLQKLLLCCRSTQPPTARVHTDMHLPASPSSLSGSYFCKAAFCFVSCFPAFAHMCLSLMPSLPFIGGELFSYLKLICFSSHSTVFTITGSAPRALCLFISKDRLPVYAISRLFLLIHNHVPYAFPFQQRLILQRPLSYRHLQTLIRLSCQLSLLNLCTVRVSDSVYFLQLFSSPCIKAQADIPVRPLLSAKMDFQCGQKHNFLVVSSKK